MSFCFNKPGSCLFSCLACKQRGYFNMRVILPCLLPIIKVFACLRSFRTSGILYSQFFVIYFLDCDTNSITGKVCQLHRRTR